MTRVRAPGVAQRRAGRTGRPAVTKIHSAHRTMGGGSYQAKAVISGALGSHGVAFEEFVAGLRRSGLQPDLRNIARIAVREPAQFERILAIAVPSPSRVVQRSEPKLQRRRERVAESGPDARPSLAVASVMDRIFTVLSSRVEDEGDPLSPQQADSVVAAVRASFPDRNDPTESLGPYYDAAGMARRLGVTRQALSGRRERGTILAVEADDGSFLYPTWQFTDDFELIDGLRPVLKTLHAVAQDGFSKAVWLCTPQRPLRDQSAARWLTDGRNPATVHSLAQAEVKRMSV